MSEELMSKLIQPDCFPDIVKFNTLISFLCQKGFTVQGSRPLKYLT